MQAETFEYFGQWVASLGFISTPISPIKAKVVNRRGPAVHKGARAPIGIGPRAFVERGPSPGDFLGGVIWGCFVREHMSQKSKRLQNKSVP